MPENRNRIIEKIRALKAKTTGNGCTEAEAMAAAEMIDKMLRKHGVDVAEIDDLDPAKQFGEHVVKIEGWREIIEALLSSIGDYTTTIPYFTSRDHQTVTFFGRRENIELADYLVDVIMRTVNTEAFAFSFTQGHFGASDQAMKERSFLIGMGLRIKEKLETMKDERSKYYVRETGRDLVVDEMEETRRMLRENGIQLTKCTSKSRRPQIDRDAFDRGQREGDNFSINAGVKGSNRASAGQALLQ
ncbi:MAG: DUF2786 domain-containing protein [Geminicoccaceae bacterium]